VTTCPLCGARQRDAVEATARPRAGRRVVDIDTPPSPRKPPPERTKAESRHVAAVKKELSSHRPVGGALDGTAAASPIVARSPPSSRRDSGKTAALLARWRELTEGLMSRDGRPHRDTDTYEVGAVVLHTTHGMGIVESIQPDGELLVIFRRGQATLPSAPGGD